MWGMVLTAPLHDLLLSAEFHFLPGGTVKTVPYASVRILGAARPCEHGFLRAKGKRQLWRILEFLLTW